MTYSLIEDQNQQLFNPWELMIGGALCILLALETNQGNDIGAMICLAALLLGAGASLVADNIGLKRGISKRWKVRSSRSTADRSPGPLRS